MDLAQIIDALRRPEAYGEPEAVDEREAVDVRQTHVSVVFLVGAHAYKIKKAVDFGFLDFRALSTRHRVCLDEVRLNRRLAASVYLGVVPVVQTVDGVYVDREGEVVEWAVKMRRLPDDASLLGRQNRGELTNDDLGRVAQRIASFHGSADRGPHIAAFGKLEVVAGNARENFEQIAPEVNVTVHPVVATELARLTEACLAEVGALIDARARRGVIVDGHGDLRLEHIYLFSSEPPPRDLVIIDCLEYAERFRFADPVNDVAFTVMELLFNGNDEGARLFADHYFEASGDQEGRRLLPFYVAYRSIVRGKVRGLELRDRNIASGRRESSLARAKAHFLLALRVLAPAERRPMLALVAGLPGTGKSTLARALAESGGLEVIRSDVVRKELAGLRADERAANAWQAGLYTPEWTRRTYEECRKRAEALIWQGKRVIVDASFPSDAQRRDFFDAARRLAVPFVWFVCECPSDTVRERLARRRGDVSDADVAVYENARRSWEPASPSLSSSMARVDTGDETRAREQAMVALGARGLL